MGLDGLETVCGVWNQARNFLCALRARFKSEWGLERNRFMGCVLNSSVRLEIGSAENPSLLLEWLELFEKPPGPPGPSPCPGEGSRSLQLTCSAEELTNDQGDPG